MTAKSIAILLVALTLSVPVLICCILAASYMFAERKKNNDDNRKA